MSAPALTTTEHGVQLLRGAAHAAARPNLGLGRTEARLRACDAVADAVLVERRGLPLGRHLVAYLVAAEGRSLHTAALRAELAPLLEPEMMPATFIVLDSFPRRADGRIDRAALPAPEQADLGTRCYQAPQGPVEVKLAALWCDLLGVPQIGRQDHFFELGGHSSLAVRLVYRVRQELAEVSMRDLFEAPTLRDFAAVISTRIHGNRGSRIAPVRPKGTARPLFLVHACDGDTGYAHELAPWIDADVPLFALAANGAYSGETVLASVEEMAASYVHSMRAVQHQGPYRVAGMGGGGMLAYEIANQLIGADQAVEFLGLIDTPSTYPWPASADNALTPPPPLFEDWLAALSWVPDELAGTLRAELASLAAHGASDALLARARQAGLFAHDMDHAAILRALVLRHAIALALSRYARPAVAVPVTLFSTAGLPDPTLGWDKVLGARLRRARLEAPPRSLLEAPHVESLGAILSTALQQTADAVAPDEFSYDPRITIQSGPHSARPLFCVPGAGASVTALAGLAGALDPAIPVHGLQPRGLCGTLVPHIDVPSAARAYLAALRGVQPHGPYRLLGHSFGGWVAYEMARQLDAAGERVDTLIVLDSDAPGEESRHCSRPQTLAKLVEIFQMSVSAPIGLGEADFAALDHEAQLVLLLQRLIAVRLLPPRSGVGLLRGIVRVFGTNLNTRYQPAGSYDGVLHLVAVPAPEHDPAQAYEPGELIAGWRRYAPQTRFWAGPGNHMTLLSAPYVGQLAAYLNPLLKEST